MAKYLRVDIDTFAGDDVTAYHQLDGDETADDLGELAADMLRDYCTYGYSVVDESDVPSQDR